MNWPQQKVSKLNFRASALQQSEWRRAYARNVSFEVRSSGRFTLKPKKPIIVAAFIFYHIYI